MLKNRLLDLIKEEGLNPNQFYIVTGLGNGYLDKIGNSLRRPTIERISKAFPHWNMEWILTGKGDKKIIDPVHITNTGTGNIANTGTAGNVSVSINDQKYVDLINSLKAELKAKDELIQSQKETIQSQKDIIDLLKAQLSINK